MDTLEELVAQLLMVACWYTAKAHERCGLCSYFLMSQISCSQLYHHYVCEICKTDLRPNQTPGAPIITENLEPIATDHPMRWN